MLVNIMYFYTCSGAQPYFGNLILANSVLGAQALWSKFSILNIEYRTRNAEVRSFSRFCNTAIFIIPSSVFCGSGKKPSIRSRKRAARNQWPQPLNLETNYLDQPLVSRQSLDTISSKLTG